MSLRRKYSKEKDSNWKLRGIRIGNDGWEEFEEASSIFYEKIERTNHLKR